MPKETTSDMITLADRCGVDATGAECLVAAIFDRTLRDLRRLRRESKPYIQVQGGRISTHEIEEFFKSAWCEALLAGTNCSPEEMQKKISRKAGANCG